MKKDSVRKKIDELEWELENYPKGTLTYKNIKGKPQPYLQWTEDGKSKCRYIRLDERKHIFLMIDERAKVQDQLKRLKAYYDRLKDILKWNPYIGNENIAVGEQSFEILIMEGAFYVDKTFFIRDWWTDKTKVTLVTRPRRFGKTLTLSMVECFFSTLYRDRGDLFENLFIWRYGISHELQGTFPVVFMSFAGMKSTSYQEALAQISSYIYGLYEKHRYMLEDHVLWQEDKDKMRQITQGLIRSDEIVCKLALFELCRMLCLYHKKKVIVLIDEYDTPMLEGYMRGYYKEIVDLMRSIYNVTLKTNEYLEKGLLTGITQVAKESMFSDMNHIRVISATSEKYAAAFGFTEYEVSQILECQDIWEKQKVKEWYDGFTFGGQTDIYNPWSVIRFLADRKFSPYWVHSGGYRMISDLILKGGDELKKDLEILIQGGSIRKTFNENISFEELEYYSEAVWPFLLAAGYLRADHAEIEGYTTADLSITNYETGIMFREMVQDWFRPVERIYNDFCKSLLDDDLEMMNEFINEIAFEMVSFFDVGRRPSRRPPERFYHGLVLGLVVDLREQYEVISNRESGYGRYDIMLRPRTDALNGIIIEFKVRNEKKESSLGETVRAAFAQIEEKQYEAELIRSGVPRGRICKYAFAFEGKQVMIEKMD